ncbi:hypothetical protein KKC1_14710 [Calderihabitans maritimus]|uniref:Uncharacterized protein n=1 Tax=Calderihabitans maritimus TaxID=1246530 RepID=A0A1Z5HSL6_9FIRM|nr:hypothetical protein KKC1_14710 [Calderihabitans maritimus]
MAVTRSFPSENIQHFRGFAARLQSPKMMIYRCLDDLIWKKPFFG